VSHFTILLRLSGQERKEEDRLSRTAFDEEKGRGGGLCNLLHQLDWGGRGNCVFARGGVGGARCAPSCPPSILEKGKREGGGGSQDPHQWTFSEKKENQGGDQGWLPCNVKNGPIRGGKKKGGGPAICRQKKKKKGRCTTPGTPFKQGEGEEGGRGRHVGGKTIECPWFLQKKGRRRVFGLGEGR